MAGRAGRAEHRRPGDPGILPNASSAASACSSPARSSPRSCGAGSVAAWISGVDQPAGGVEVGLGVLLNPGDPAVPLGAPGLSPVAYWLTTAILVLSTAAAGWWVWWRLREHGRKAGRIASQINCSTVVGPAAPPRGTGAPAPHARSERPGPAARSAALIVKEPDSADFAMSVQSTSVVGGEMAAERGLVTSSEAVSAEAATSAETATSQGNETLK